MTENNEKKTKKKKNEGEKIEPKDQNDQHLINTAASGAGMLMVLFALQRLANFGLNQLLIRETDPATYGIASIQFELVLSTVLFLSRECFRLTLLRSHLQGRTPSQCQQLVNAAWMPVPLGLLAVGAVLVLVERTGISADMSQTHKAAIYLYCAGAFAETLAEPLFIISHNCLLPGIRFSAEGTATMVKTIVTFILVKFGRMKMLAFGCGQVGYGLALWLAYVLLMVGALNNRKMKLSGNQLPFSTWRDLLPGRPSRQLDRSASWVNWQQLRLAAVLFCQGVFKHALTEGDKLVLAATASNYDQGVYALAQNYGSLAARLVFMPMEESARLIFSKLTWRQEGQATGRSAQQVGAEDLQLSQSLLSSLLRFSTIIGMIIFSFGFNYTDVLLQMLTAARWTQSQAPETLSWYTLYVLVMAVNGMMEAFVFSVATSRQVSKISLSLFACFGVFAASAPALMSDLGTPGLVIANCLGMCCRIGCSGLFAAHHFARVPGKQKRPGRQSFRYSWTFLRNAVPNWFVLSCFVASFVVTRASKSFFLGPAIGSSGMLAIVLHIFVGLICLLVTLVSIVTFEDDLIQQVTALRQGDNASKKKED